MRRLVEAYRFSLERFEPKFYDEYGQRMVGKYREEARERFGDDADIFPEDKVSYKHLQFHFFVL